MSRRTRCRASVASVVGAVALAIAGCGESTDGTSGSDPDTGVVAEDPGPIHVHGLGVNPSDGALLIATHTGLFRAPEGSSEAERVADRYQDTMGFTVTGPDEFLGSGHPDGEKDEDLPPFLGLIRSTDAGETWDPVSLLGEADFHVLEASGDVIYGYGSDFETREQRLLVSGDAGESWEQRPLPEEPSGELTEESLLGIAIDPGDSATAVASGQEALWITTDAGRDWRFLSANPGLLAWSEAGVLHLIDADGKVEVSRNQGRTWEAAGSLGGEPAALEAVGESLYAALHDGTVKQSTDGGKTWTVRFRP